MNFRHGVRAVLAVAALALAGSTADAQTSYGSTAALSPTQSVRYVPFVVTTAGTFRFYTQATNVDPQIFLFEGTPGAFGALLDNNDDGCFEPLCPLLDGGARRNALITESLNPGDFTLAVSLYSFDEAEARAGVNDAVMVDVDFPFTIDSQDGSATFGQISTVPEPSSYVLMASGLVGLLGVRRWRRTA
jgi:hypothetical protein